MEFMLEIILPATPQRIYEGWLDSGEHTRMTGGEAVISNMEGDNFTAWDGYIWGTNLELRPYDFIKQSWRTSEFEPEQEDSTIEITLEALAEGTLMKLYHYNLTQKDHAYKQGWEDHYFTPMLAYFTS